MSSGREQEPPFFRVEHLDPRTGARVGRLATAHGTCETPCFLPVASHGTLRGLGFKEAAECGTAILMANAWYLFQNTTTAALRLNRGVHGQIGWPGILCTDSGGYQTFSLKDSSKITDDGVLFTQSGEMLTPRHVVEMQRHLGSDIMMILDDCAPFPCERARVEEAVRRTTVWATQSIAAYHEVGSVYGQHQSIYGIVQGGVHALLRQESCTEIAALGFDGFGIGGLSIGMPRTVVRDMTQLCCESLPDGKPRHLLGVGLPGQILEGIADGADTFDCVLPIRKAQRGVAYTRFGPVYYKRPQPSVYQDEPLDPTCGCDTCRAWSREELRLLFRSDKPAAGNLAAVHNLHFYHQLLEGARKAIPDGSFAAYASDFMRDWDTGELAAVS